MRCKLIHFKRRTYISDFISCDSDIFSQNCEFVSCNFVLIEKKSLDCKKQGPHCEIKSHNYLFLFIYSVAETGFHSIGRH